MAHGGRSANAANEERPWRARPQERGAGWRPVEGSEADDATLDRRRRFAWRIWRTLSEGGRLPLWVHFWDHAEARWMQHQRLLFAFEAMDDARPETLILEVRRASDTHPAWHCVVPLPAGLVDDQQDRDALGLPAMVREAYWREGVAVPPPPTDPDEDEAGDEAEDEA